MNVIFSLPATFFSNNFHHIFDTATCNGGRPWLWAMLLSQTSALLQEGWCAYVMDGGLGKNQPNHAPGYFQTIKYIVDGSGMGSILPLWTIIQYYSWHIKAFGGISGLSSPAGRTQLESIFFHAFYLPFDAGLLACWRWWCWFAAVHHIGNCNELQGAADAECAPSFQVCLRAPEDAGSDWL